MNNMLISEGFPEKKHKAECETESRGAKKGIRVLALEFVKFNMGGLAVSAVEYVVYSLLLLIGVYYRVAFTSANIIKIFVQFFINQNIVFKVAKTESKSGNQRNFLLRVLRQASTSAFMLSVKAFLVWFIVSKIGVGENAAYFIILLLEAPLSFFLGKYWTFRV